MSDRLELTAQEFVTAYQYLRTVAKTNDDRGTAPVNEVRAAIVADIDLFLTDLDIEKYKKSNHNKSVGITVRGAFIDDLATLSKVYNYGLDLDFSDADFAGNLFDLPASVVVPLGDFGELPAETRKSIFALTTEIKGAGPLVGTAWIYAKTTSATGYRYVVATAAHAIDDFASEETKHTIVLPGQTASVELKVMGVDHTFDVAFLTFESRVDLMALPQSEEPIHNQDYVVVVGNQSSNGIVENPGFVNEAAKLHSSTGQNLPVIQDDSAAQPGDSGGPLLDAIHDVVGMCVAGEGNRINYSVPIQYINAAYEQIKEKGYVEHPNANIAGAFMDENFRKQFRIPSEYTNAIFLEVIPADSNLARAGLKPGDVILGYNGKALPAAEEQAKMWFDFESLPIDQIVRLKVCRAGKVIDVDISLESSIDRQIPCFVEDGFTFYEMTNAEKKSRKLPPVSGLVMTYWEQECPAVGDQEATYYPTQFVLQSVNGRKIESLQALRDIYAGNTDVANLTFEIVYFQGADVVKKLFLASDLL